MNECCIFQPLYNCGIAWAKQNSRPKALDYLLQAQKCKVEKKHEIVELTISKVDVSTLSKPARYSF